MGVLYETKEARKLGVVTQAWHTSTENVEAGGSSVRSQPKLHSESETSLG